MYRPKWLNEIRGIGPGMWASWSLIDILYYLDTLSPHYSKEE